MDRSPTSTPNTTAHFNSFRAYEQANTDKAFTLPEPINTQSRLAANQQQPLRNYTAVQHLCQRPLLPPISEEGALLPSESRSTQSTLSPRTERILSSDEYDSNGDCITPPSPHRVRERSSSPGNYLRAGVNQPPPNA